MIKPTVAVFVHHPECSVHSAHGLIRALSAEYSVHCIDSRSLTSTALSRYDLVCFPGGIGDSDSWHKICESGADAVREYVATGGAYLGICMGAYWAGHHYFDIVRGIEPVQYIRRKNTDIRRSFGTVVAVDWQKRREYMYFYDGCALVDHGSRHRVIARYTNGDSAAVIQGRIGLIGPHPESDVYWYSKPYMQPYWHEYHHHTLLSEFVDRLIY